MAAPATERLRSSRFPTTEELDYIASRLAIRALERYKEPAAAVFLRQTVADWRRGLDEFDLRDATELLRQRLELLATAVQNREDRLIEDGRMVVPDQPLER